MRHNLALLLSAVVFVSSAGCLFPRLKVGGSWANSWSAPAPMAKPDRYSGVDVSFTPTLWGPALGLYHCVDGDERFTAPYVTYNLGQAWGMPIFKPLIGRYHWSHSPEETGLLTGLKVGAGIPIAELEGTCLFLNVRIRVAQGS